jgi:hypothetical protein
MCTSAKKLELCHLVISWFQCAVRELVYKTLRTAIWGRNQGDGKHPSDSLRGHRGPKMSEGTVELPRWPDSWLSWPEHKTKRKEREALWKNVKTRKGWHSFCWYLLISLLMMTCKLNHTSSKLKKTRIGWTRSKCTITFWIMGCQGTR